MITTIDVGIKPQEYIASKGRWKLTSSSFDKLQEYATHVDFDYVNHELKLHVLDAHIDGEAVVEDWILDMVKNGVKNQILTLAQYNPDGEIITNRIFKDLKLVGHRAPFDYQENELYVEHEVMFTYGSYER